MMFLIEILSVARKIETKKILYGIKTKKKLAWIEAKGV